MSLNDMSVEDFAQYVINNLHRATLSNALGSTETDVNGHLKQPGIAGKLNNDDFYKFTEFVECVNKLIPKSSLPKEKVYEVLVAGNKALKEFTSDFKYNERMIIDTYIINLWSIVNGN